jgi:hypothetical protein
MQSTNGTLLNMCIELHLKAATHLGQITLTHINSISSSHVRHWLTSCNLPICLCSPGQTGVPLDDYVRFDISDADRGSREEEA